MEAKETADEATSNTSDGCAGRTDFGQAHHYPIRMRETFYHLDRRNELAAGQILELESVDAPEEAPLDELYPGGLSNHGSYYCNQDLYEADEAALWDVAAELVFELVRVARFPGRPSRFQSIFGFEARRDLDRFAETYADSPYTIWRVRAERFPA